MSSLLVFPPSVHLIVGGCTAHPFKLTTRHEPSTFKRGQYACCLHPLLSLPILFVAHFVTYVLPTSPVSETCSSNATPVMRPAGQFSFL